MLTDATRRQLQRLRFLLEEAVAASQNQTEVGRHSALVLLDGACEYAMGISLGHLARPIRFEFPKKFAELRDALPAWTPDSWTSVSQLHQARNQAQHQGVVSDASYIPAWASQSQRFIESLVDAAFGVQLRDVLIADSVETVGIRDSLAEAERALEQQDALASFIATAEAFDAARAAWRGQRAEAIGQLILQASGLSRFSQSEVDPTNLALMRFEELLEVQPFAPDIAEYHWFVARRAEVEADLQPTLDDATRAHLFAVAWVLRWEAFAAGYEARRYPPPVMPYEPPVTGAAQPAVFDVQVEKLHHIGSWNDEPTLDNVRYAVRIVLSDVPAESPEVWAREVNAVLDRIVSEKANGSVSSAGVYPNGVVRFHGVGADASGSALLEWLHVALESGWQQYVKAAKERRALDARLPHVREALLTAMQSAGADFLSPEVVATERDDGQVRLGVRLHLEENPDSMLPQLLQDSVLAQLGGRSDVQYFESTIWFELDIDPDEAAALVAAAASTYRERAASRAAGLSAVDDRLRALEDELRRELPGAS